MQEGEPTQYHNITCCYYTENKKQSTQTQMETLTLPEQRGEDTISSFVLKVDWSCEKALITPKSTVFLPRISTASEAFPYLTLLHYNMKGQVVILLAAKGGHFSSFLLYTPGLSLQAQRIYSSLHKLLYQLRNSNSCQTPQKSETSAPSQQGLK